MAPRSVADDRLYRLLEVEPDAREAEIKRSYRRLAMKHHPDKGGDPDKFKELSNAYRVLSDPQSRARYDLRGDVDPGESAGDAFEGATDPFRVMERLFGDGLFGLGRGGRGAAARIRRRTPDMVKQLPVTLEELYTGATRRLHLTRQVVKRDKGPRVCSACKGQGVQVQTILRGPMMQQIQRTCQACGGEGRLFATAVQREVLEVHIPRGAPDGHKVVFAERADEHPDADAGDVVVVLQQTPHARFRRRGADLFVERSVALVEALCGLEIRVAHLDGRHLLVKSSPGDIARPTLGLPWLHGKQDAASPSWSVFNNTDCPGLSDVAQVDVTDPEMAQRVWEDQFRGKGVCAFVIDGTCTRFKAASRSMLLVAMEPKPACTLYMRSERGHPMKAVPGEGMPLYGRPSERGNLFLILDIQFPESLPEEARGTLRRVLPPPLKKGDPGEREGPPCEEIFVTEMDPEASYKDFHARTQATADDARPRATAPGSWRQRARL